MVKKNILGTIGTTPMVRINRLCPNPNVKIFAKLEGFNPTGSIKDRIALRMIEAAERDGRLTPGKTIIEPTSGNTGIGLAIVGIVKGYPVEIVMSEAVSIERRKIIRSYGAKVILTPAEEGTDGAIRLARKKVADAPGRYFMPDQFANASNYLAHYQSTALEIWQQKRQVVHRAGLAHIRRGKIDGNAPVRELEAQIFDGGAHTVGAFTHSGIRQAHDGKGGQTAGNVGLHCHGKAAQAVQTKASGNRIHVVLPYPSG